MGVRMGCDLSIFLFYFLYLYRVGFGGNVLARKFVFSIEAGERNLSGHFCSELAC